MNFISNANPYQLWRNLMKCAGLVVAADPPAAVLLGLELGLEAGVVELELGLEAGVVELELEAGGLTV